MRPVAIAVERVLFQVNARTAMSVGQASGLALAIAGRERIPVVQYSPNEVKLAVAGDGGAGKEEVQEMVARLLSLSEVPRPGRRGRRARARDLPLVARAACRRRSPTTSGKGRASRPRSRPRVRQKRGGAR